MAKTLICVNTLTSIDNQVYGNHCQMWFKLGRDYPEDKFMLCNLERMSIDNARNHAAKVAMEYECDYLYFIDDDMILAPRTYNVLRSHDADIAMAQTFIRSYPFQPMYFSGYYEGAELKGIAPWPEDKDEPDVLNVDAIGCACVLIKVSLLRKLEPPFFVTGPNHTEDIYFCVKAINKIGRENLKIIVDKTVPTGHMMDKQILHKVNRDEMKKFYEFEKMAFDGVDLTKVNAADRGDEYAKQTELLFEA